MTEHVCTCGECGGELFSDRCRFERENDVLLKALDEIAYADYRGNRPYEFHIAHEALKKVGKARD